MVTLVFAAVTMAFLGTITVAMLAARAAHNATKRADQAVAEAALATKEAYRARADLHKVTRLLLAEVKRAEDARKVAVVPIKLERQRDLMGPHPEPIGGLKPLVDAFVDCEAAIAAGEPRSNFLFTTSGVVIGRKSPERLRWEAGEPKGERVAPFPVLADGTRSLTELAGACGQYASGLPIAYGQVEQIITQFYEGRG